jgi:transglutaminase-like putative cysteine protease
MTVAQPAPSDRHGFIAEESIPLRILVQLIVFIGIAAVDEVASTDNSLWAIPLSAVGASWGWYARHKRNVVVKFCVAIAMIAMLVVFLNDLITQVEETRLLLARLLIQLQVLHSFDLPRRKDLGYSVVIGFILISLGATLSQTMTYALWLMGFLLLAIPFLILDHRSRLGVVTQSMRPKQLGINPLPLAGLLAMVLVLGLTIFALLPRMSGFQLRNFPVSVNLNVQRQTAQGGIITRSPTANGNSNTIGADGTATGDGSGQVAESGEGELPPLFGTEIDATTNGKQDIKPALVMRVRSQAQLFWRVMAYDEFTGRGWRISRNAPEQIRTIKRPSWSLEFYLPPDPNFTINPNNLREVIQTYTIVTDNFPNLVPAASIPYRLFFPSEEMDIDLEWNLRSPGVLPKNLTYTVISAVPVRDRSQLIRTPRSYAPAVEKYYLQLPADFADLQPQLQQAIRELQGDRQFSNVYDQAEFLAEALKARYVIKDVSIGEGKDVVSEFLTQGGGQPTHFVSALAVMLRSLGIPTRYAVGFNSGKFNVFTGYYEVQNTDAQSLVEVYFPNYGWLAFDPVPGNPTFPSSVEDDRTFGVLQSFWQWLASILPAPIAQFFSAMGKAIAVAIAWLINLLVSWGWAGVIFGVVIVFGVLLTLWALWQGWLWLRDQLYLRGLHPAERAYAHMLRFFAEQGMPKSPQQTPEEYARAIESKLSPEQLSAMRQITQAYQDWHYGDRTLNLAALKALLQKLTRWRIRRQQRLQVEQG